MLASCRDVRSTLFCSHEAVAYAIVVIVVPRDTGEPQLALLAPGVLDIGRPRAVIAGEATFCGTRAVAHAEHVGIRRRAVEDSEAGVTIRGTRPCCCFTSGRKRNRAKTLPD